MKISGNREKVSDYYIGLDVGTNSVGWAVTDTEYNILKFRGNAMWGARLFEKANPAAERRQYRIARRLNKRRKQRLEWLELLFDEEISKTDPSFFIRLKESSLLNEDKTHRADFPIFNDSDYTDKDYYRDYPTAYHLRNELIESDKPHDIRLVFLALHHIIKSRGHFLFDMELSDEYKTVDIMLDEFTDRVFEAYGVKLGFADKEKFVSVLSSGNLGINAKKKLLRDGVTIEGESDDIDFALAIDSLSGAAINLSKLFFDEELKDSGKFSLNEDLDEALGETAALLGEESTELLRMLKEIFDSGKLAQMLGGHQYICEAKVERYETNKRDLKRLKEYVRKNAPDKYREIFCDKKDKLNNFAAYSGKTLESGDYSCKQEDFCKYIKKTLPELKNDSEFADIYAKLDNNTLLSKLKGADNGVIPYQLHLKELKKILDNAENYLELLRQTDENGVSVKEKIISVFSFRIPYYVGPLNKNAAHSWVVRTDEKIYPWNFNRVVDTEKSSEGFIINLISKCGYTGEEVLPKESLLFSEYCVWNEINPLKVNGEKISPEIKKEIFDELFLKSNSKVTVKLIKGFLLKKCYIKPEDEISGVADILKSRLKSYHSLSKIMSVEENYETAENIIRAVTIFGDDKKLLKGWLKRNCPSLDERQTAAVCRLSFSGWGSLSKTLLTEIYSPDENGEARSIMDMLRSTDNNLMQLLSNSFKFAENAEAHLKEKCGERESLREMIEDMYISPAVKRSLLQTVKIVDEITDIKKFAPKKIMIEVARDREGDNAKKATVSRRERLLGLYKACRDEYPELYKAIEAADEGDLRRDALYLYYTQFGKCMYSGEKISLERLDSDYDIDHILPQSRIKDDSIDNRVLVKKICNREKSNEYPIKSDWQKNMQPFWRMLKDKGYISQKKYDRLTRRTPLTEEELSAFVARQLVETRQSTKALAEIFKTMYGAAGTKVVYSKAGNVSEFRQEFKLIKCRDANDLHHAKDAYLNIVVGNVYDTKFTDAFFKNIRNENYSLNKVFNYSVPGAWDKDKSIAAVKSVMRKNNILTTRMPYETRGALYDLQLMPAGKGQLPAKSGKPIEKYGGYNKVKGAYFFVAEHTEKKVRVRSILPVYIYKKALYEKDPIAYCTEILGLCDPKIIYPRLLTDAPIEIDGKKLSICGRSGRQLLCRHEYQLAASPANERYIKEISKYVARSAAERAENGIRLAPDSEICSEKNTELYRLFLQKLKAPVYNRLFDAQLKKLTEKEKAFAELPLIAQCRMLLEILKLFKCDRQASDFSAIGEAANCGIICLNASLKKVKSAFAICSSVTGLYSRRTDLLK